MKKVRSAFVVFLFSVFLIFGVSAYFSYVKADFKDPDKDLYKQIELFSDAVTIVQSDYVEEVDPKKLVYGAIEGMLSSLDEYSQFMDPESYREMEIDTKGEFGGLGIEVGIRDGILTVIAPIDGTPAAKAGLKAGDKIIKIDGESTRDIKLTDAVKELRGKPGTKVELTIIREEEKLLDFTIVRSIIKIKSIKTAEMLDESVGYIKLVEFQQNTPKELEGKLKNLKKEGMKALILDLRNNPGGLLDVAYEVCDIFLEKGKVVVSLKGRVPTQNKVYTAHGKRSFIDFPMAILVNQGSASASEIVAGALQDHKRGVIVGGKTYGKGSVQTVIPLKDGSAARITTAAYYTPNGNSIAGKGIIPDVDIELEEEKEEVIRDNQLQAAMDLLKDADTCEKYHNEVYLR
ncbi:MAG: S41 family peptidase [Candidatus Omnitrophica bacterium]|nr:S41 family peptidase [Candidatus Omnitrophota bacterium]